MSLWNVTTPAWSTSPAGTGPGDAVVRLLLGDDGVELALLAGDAHLPVQVGVIYLADLVDEAEELRKLLELRPLVVGRATGTSTSMVSTTWAIVAPRPLLSIPGSPESSAGGVEGLALDSGLGVVDVPVVVRATGSREQLDLGTSTPSGAPGCPAGSFCSSSVSVSPPSYSVSRWYLLHRPTVRQATHREGMKSGVWSLVFAGIALVWLGVGIAMAGCGR